MRTWFHSLSRGNKKSRKANRPTRLQARVRPPQIRFEHLEIRTLLAADLSIDKTAALAAVAPGELLTYNISISNTGVSDATGTTFSDALPAGETFVAATSSQGVVQLTGGRVTGNLGTIAALTGTATVAIEVIVDTSAPVTLSNSASVSSPDDSASPKTSTVMTTVHSLADVSVTAATSASTGVVGTNETYTITVKNNDAVNAATGVVLTDALPADVAFVSAMNTTSGVTLTQNGNVVTDSIGNLAAGASNTVTIVVKPNAAGAVTNTAVVTTFGDPNTTNNIARTTTPINGITTPAVDLAIANTPLLSSTVVGASETYTITVKNNDATNAATGVVITDVLPAGVTFVSAIDTTSGVTLTPTGGVLSDAVASLAAGATETISVVVTPTAPGVMINVASVEGLQADTIQTNNTATVTTNVNGIVTPAIDLLITNTASLSTDTVGTNETYTITVKNNDATSAATGVVITDMLPAGVTFVSATDTTSGVTLAPTGGVLSDAIARLAAGAEETITVVVTPTAPGVMINVASVEGLQADTIQANNTATVTTNVNGIVTPAVDLSITDNASLSTGVVGTNETYTITVKNNDATNAATGVVITDLLPAGVTFVSAIDTTSGVTLSANGGVLSDAIASLAAGATETITLVVTPTAPGVMINVATVEGLQADTIQANNTTTVTTSVNGIVTPAIDLSVTNTASLSTGVVGTNETYTITVKNNDATNAATGVVITDVLPAGVTFVSATDTTSGVALTPNGGVLSDAIASLAAGATESITVVVTPTVPGVMINVATVEGFQADTIQGNNTATVTTSVNGIVTPAIDLAITNTASLSIATVGTNETYTITVKNNDATNAATGVVITDVLPAGVTLVSATDTTSGVTLSANGGVLSDAIASLAAGATETITVVVTPTLPGVMINVATVEGVQADTIQANNTATVTTSVNGIVTPAIDLAITNNASLSTGVVGTNETYTITVKNNDATNVATGVVITDLLPAGVTFVSATDTTSGVALTPTGGVLSDAIASLAAGATETITVVVTPTLPGVMINVATVEGLQADTIQANNTATVTTSVKGIVTPAIDLAITNTASLSIGTVGTNETYTITVKNNDATNVATGVVITDVLPAGVTFVSATDTTSGVTLSTNGGLLSDVIASLAAGATETITVVVTPTLPGVMINVAAVEGLQADTNQANNTATVTNSVTGIVTPTIDLSITNTASLSTGVVGTNETYTITVKNNDANNVATGVVMTDLLPAGVTFVSATDTTSGVTLSANGGVLSDAIASLAAGATETITVVVTPTLPGVMINVATVEGLQADTIQANNTATVTTNVQGIVTPAIDLAITSSASLSTGVVGTNETYTITVKNNDAANAATGVVMTDVLPAGVTFVSATDTTSGVTLSANGGVLSDVIASLAAGATETITVVVTPTLPGVMVNVATVEGLQADTNQANNTATVTTSVKGIVTPAIDLSITNTASLSTGVVGTNETYTITVKNNDATNVATGVVMTDLLPAGVTFVSAVDTTSGVTLSANGGVLSDVIASLAAGATETITVVVTPTLPGVMINVAAVEGLQADTNQANNTATVTTSVTGIVTPTIDLSITNTASLSTGVVGTNETYTITIKNNDATNVATGVVMTDLLPVGVTFVSATDTTSGVTLSANGGLLSDVIASLAAGATETITVVVTPTLPGVMINVAAVEGLQVDTNQANNIATVTTSVKGIVVPTIDLAITNTASLSIGAVGTNETYTITVKNNDATNAATGVVMTDLLPAGVTFVSATDTTSGVTLSATGGVLSDVIASLAAGATETITVVVTPTLPGVMINVATVEGLQADTNQANNTATVTTNVSGIAPPPIDLSITNTASLSTGIVGTNETFTITVKNNDATNAATGVVITDLLPAGVTFVSAVDTTSGVTLTLNGGVLSDMIASLAAGATETISVVVVPSVAGQITNSVSVTGNQADSNVLNNAASLTLLVNPPAPPFPTFFIDGQPGDNSAATFVRNLYRELLGREADASGFAAWTNYLTSNPGQRSAVISGFMNSQEYKNHVVTTIFEVFLHRAPDASGLQSWANALGQPGNSGTHKGGNDELNIVADILSSSEYFNLHGGTNKGFVDALYVDLLGRTADASGEAGWTQGLANNTSRSAVALAIASSAEADHKLLNADFPAAGNAADLTLSPPGGPAGGPFALASLAGGGWENLFFQGSAESTPQANDTFFQDLATQQLPWDDVIGDMLDSAGYFDASQKP